MLDFDEIEQKTNELQTKLQSVGESLWCNSFRRKITRVREKNIGTRLLGRC